MDFIAYNIDQDQTAQNVGSDLRSTPSDKVMISLFHTFEIRISWVVLSTLKLQFTCRACSPSTTRSWRLSTLLYKPFEHITGKAENAGDQHFLIQFQQCLILYFSTNISTSLYTLYSGNAFKLDISYICRCYIQLKLKVTQHKDYTKMLWNMFLQEERTTSEKKTGKIWSLSALYDTIW